MDLPISFLDKMKGLLKEEFEDFLESYDDNKYLGLRVNTLKIGKDEFLKRSPFNLTSIPWVKEGFYYGAEDRPGRHPYHEAGLYYIQEPSAMAVGELVDPKPGEKVLDLCAAPGGKTTHMAAKMNQQGILISNEIHPQRAKILSQNVERMGIKNAVVTNETPERLAQRFVSYFDRILVDAPCSGEGMFRKDPQACKEWSLDNVSLCANRQMDILKYAAAMLKSGGRLVYSTCTFSPEENEGTINAFIQEYPWFEIEEIKTYEGFSQGQREWIEGAEVPVEKTFRLWPHKLQGEGHYIAVLKKNGADQSPKYLDKMPAVSHKLLGEYFKFAEESLLYTPKGQYLLFGEQLYLLPEDMLSLESLKVVRPGWHLGTIKKNRFEPSHALALSLREEEVKNKWSLITTSHEVTAYLKGEALEAHGVKGWYLVEVDGYSLGWGKLVNDRLKNHYPKGLRWCGGSW